MDAVDENEEVAADDNEDEVDDNNDDDGNDDDAIKDDAKGFKNRLQTTLHRNVNK